MPGLTNAFLSEGGTILINVGTGSTMVQVSTGAVQGLLLTNFSTNVMNVLVAASSLTTMSTLSTAALVPGFLLGVGGAVGVVKQMTVSCPPNPWVSAMTTGTGLTGILGVSPGIGMI